MQVIYPQNRPSPLEGFGDAMGTLADAVIKSRERQALNQDADLIGQAIVKAQSGGQDPTEWQRNPGVEVPSGDVPEPGQGGGNPLDAFKEIMPQMKTNQGRFQLLKLMLDQRPVELYSATGEPTGRRVPKDAKFLTKQENQGTSVYNPTTGEWTQVPGKFAQMKTQPETTVLDPEGNVVGTTQNKVFQMKNPKKEWKPELFEGPEGERKWVAPGEEVPDGFSMAGKASKNDPTGFTREGITWMKTVGLDPSKKASWEEFNGFRRLAKDKDVGMWALDKATTAMSKNFSFNREKDPFKRARMVVDQARELMKGKDMLTGEAAGQPAAGKAGTPPSYPQQVQGPGGVYTRTGQFDPASGKPIYQSPDGRLMLPK